MISAMALAGSLNRTAGKSQGCSSPNVGFPVVDEQGLGRSDAELLQAMLVDFGRRLGPAELAGEHASVEIGEPGAAQDVVANRKRHIGEQRRGDSGGTNVARPLRHDGGGVRPTAAVDLNQRGDLRGREPARSCLATVSNMRRDRARRHRRRCETASKLRRIEASRDRECPPRPGRPRRVAIARARYRNRK